MAAKEAKFNRVDSLQVLHKFRIFNISEIFTILLWNINTLKSAEKSKTYFIIFLSEIEFTITVTPILAIKLICMVNVLKQSTKNKTTENTNVS